MSFVLPVVLGHRGARAVKTENTIEAFRYACQSGVKWVELDAMLSADKTVMVFHDETLDRMAGVDGRLDEFTAERLRALTLKTGAKIPTLAEVLDVLNEFQACVNIEIKPSRPELARETARQVWQVIREKGFDDPDRLFFPALPGTRWKKRWFSRRISAAAFWSKTFPATGAPRQKKYPPIQSIMTRIC